MATNTNSIENPQRMQCMEIWGGNCASRNSFQAPGLDIYLHSAPYGAAANGGDIYYLTSCASGRISRLLLADVSGHGTAASRLAIVLRDLLRDSVNTISQQRFVEAMNAEFTSIADEGGFATAAVATYFAPRRNLSVSLAGHPTPFYYSSAERRWTLVDSETAVTSRQLRNLPLGIEDSTRYPGIKLTTENDDMFLLYSDAFSESFGDQSRQLGVRGLLELVNRLGPLAPVEVIPALLESLHSHSSDGPSQDDATLILGHCTMTTTRWRDNLLAPFRYLMTARDRTELDQCC